MLTVPAARTQRSGQSSVGFIQPVLAVPSFPKGKSVQSFTDRKQHCLSPFAHTGPPSVSAMPQEETGALSMSVHSAASHLLALGQELPTRQGVFRLYKLSVSPKEAVVQDHQGLRSRTILFDLQVQNTRPGETRPSVEYPDGTLGEGSSKFQSDCRYYLGSHVILKLRQAQICSH